MKNYRMPVNPQVRQQGRPYTFPAPVRGWISNENLAASGPAGAKVLENWFPTSTGIRVRGGLLKAATISEGPVTSLFVWQQAGVEHFFAADNNNIFEITSVADPDVIPDPVIEDQTSGYYSTAQIANVDGDNFLVIVNGTDDALVYDGTDFTVINDTSTPAFSGVPTSKLSFVWSYASRLFFVESGTMNAWYIAVDSFAGVAARFSLAGIFQKGGELVFGGTWSLDSGDGLDDKCVFVSSEGEVAVYQGINPSSADTWQKVGVYQITPPLGKNGTMRAGGDLMVACEDGIVPLSQAVNKDVVAISLAAITRSIEPDWNKAVAANRALPWEILKWPTQNMAIVSVPTSSADRYCFVVNMETGAWAKYTGWDTRCLALWQDYAYFGTSDGKIMQCEVGGNDDGMPYVCTYVGLFDHLQSPGIHKTVSSARTTFITGSPINPKISVSVNYQVKLPAAPNSPADYATDTWDSGLWDVAVWDAGQVLESKTKWVSIGKSGFAVAPQIQMTFGITPKPNAELVAIDVVYETGGIMN